MLEHLLYLMDKMMREYSPAEIRKMCKGGNIVGGRMMGKNKLRERLM